MQVKHLDRNENPQGAVIRFPNLGEAALTELDDQPVAPICEKVTGTQAALAQLAPKIESNLEDLGRSRSAMASKLILPSLSSVDS